MTGSSVKMLLFGLLLFIFGLNLLIIIEGLFGPIILVSPHAHLSTEVSTIINFLGMLIVIAGVIIAYNGFRKDM